MQNIAELKQHFPHHGKVEWIGLRPSKGVVIIEKPCVLAVTDGGLEGDKAGQRVGAKRQVTLIQAEYLDVLKSIMPTVEINFTDLRRNLAISGINLNALNECKIKVGEAILEVTGFCHPCKKLEENLGYGVFNAMRGHGGITAKVIEGGMINHGDKIKVLHT